jgi:hypothetical protein
MLQRCLHRVPVLLLLLLRHLLLLLLLRCRYA